MSDEKTPEEEVEELPQPDPDDIRRDAPDEPGLQIGETGQRPEGWVGSSVEETDDDNPDDD